MMITKFGIHHLKKIDVINLKKSSCIKIEKCAIKKPCKKRIVPIIFTVIITENHPIRCGVKFLHK